MYKHFPFKAAQTLIFIHSQIMRVLIITLSFALVVFGKHFLIETENSEIGSSKYTYLPGKDYNGGSSDSGKTKYPRKLFMSFYLYLFVIFSFCTYFQ